MKVHLIFSPSLLYSPYEVLGENMSPPLGILYLASYLRSKIKDIEIKITDGCKIGYKYTIEEVKTFGADIVGISFYTTTAYGAFRLSQEVKILLPEALVVFGGPHTTALPRESLNMSKADIAVVGEGEETFHQIVKLKSEGKNISEFLNLEGAYFKVNGEIHENEPRAFITPLDCIPMPAWDLVDVREYKGWYISKQQPEAIIFFSRGCPYECTFCSNCVWKSSKPTVRFRSPEKIADEMEYLNNNFSVKEVFDNSDEFNCNIDHAIKVCREIKKRKLGMTWKTQLRITPFTEELAKEMAEAGCWYVHLGIESGNQQTLDGINKRINLKDAENTCRILKKYNIKILALFMLFNVWEKDGKLMYEDAKMTKNTLKFASMLAKNNLVDYIGWSVTTPYPGSPLYEIALRHNILKPSFVNNWEAWQKEGLFMMDLPSVSKMGRGMIKLQGDILRIKCILRAKHFTLKDIPFLIKRGIHIFSNIFR